MSEAAEAAKKSFHRAADILRKLAEEPADALIRNTLEQLLELSGSRFACLMYNREGQQIAAQCISHPAIPDDQAYLTDHHAIITEILLPQMRRSTALIANSSTSVKSELGHGYAWRILQRTLLIPLINTLGDKKGQLALFGRQASYSSQDILSLEPLLSLCASLLQLDQEHQPTLPDTPDPVIDPFSDSDPPEYDYQFINSRDPRFITTEDGNIIRYNAAADHLLALPDEKLKGLPITRLLPGLVLNTEPKTHEYQTLVTYSRTGRQLKIQAYCKPVMHHQEQMFSVQVQDIETQTTTQTERHERSFRIQRQQRATLEVARIATQEEAPFYKLVKRICKLTASTLDAPRAGIWLAEENSPVYHNIIQTDRNMADYCEQRPILLNSSSHFVRQLEQVRVLTLHNLNTWPDNSFFTPEYIRQHQTASLICAAFIKNSNLIGFLVIEETQHCNWHEDQYNFVREVANYLHILVLNEHRQKIQSDLIRQEQQFRLLFFDSPLAMMAFDRDTFKFIAVNHTATEVFGYSLNEMLNKGIYDLIPIQQVMDIHALLEDSNQTGGYHVLETRMQKHSGEVVDVEIHAHSINLSSKPSVLMVVHDITVRKQMESSLHRSQKMEAVGQLVGGIAHDFNNITNIIKGHAELLEMKLENSSIVSKHIDAITKAANRTTSLTHKLMQFSRQQQISSEVCQLDDIINELLELMSKSLTKNIQVVLEIAPDLWPVMIDRGDFEDVMINLAINARDAMSGHGTLTIEVCNQTFKDTHPVLVRDRKPGDYCCISVRDTGSGIPKELQEKIFDPFFTTKDKGKGTGLGLSMVYGFVKRSGGFLELRSQEGQGTTFYLWLPRAEGSTAPAPEQRQKALDVYIPEGHTALVVDDEDDLRLSLSEMLQAIGFHVQQAESADKALDIIRNSGRPFSLVLSDIVMPGEHNGVDLAQEIKAQHPETRVILASGYAENISLQEARNAACELLKKPFDRQDLLKALSSWQWR